MIIVAVQVPYMPDELWMIILSYLCGSVRDLVAMSAVNRQLRPLARRQETTDERPIFTEQEGVREVWREVRFGMRTSRMGCVRTVATGHTDRTTMARVVEVGEWVVTCSDAGMRRHQIDHRRKKHTVERNSQSTVRRGWWWSGRAS